MITYGILLTAMYLVREWINDRNNVAKDKMISELTNKLMARDFTEYTEQTQPPKVYEPVEQTEESQYWQEIEQNKL
jgi:hypothetical protein